MRAAVVHELGGRPRIEDVPEPEDGPVVDLGAAGLNPMDLAIASGRFYGPVSPPPYVAGREGVGRVRGASSFADGTRVYTDRAGTGTFAERFAIAEERVYALPDGDDDSLAVALGVA